MTWRAEDERLLRRLEDEALFERVWDALAPPETPPPHARASGVLVSIRRSEASSQLLDGARRGDLAPLLRALHRPDPSALEPKHAHHLALLWDRLADALERDHEQGSARARQRGLSMWLWLAAEEDYLHRLAERVIDGGLSPGEIDRAAKDAPVSMLDRLGRRAKEGADELSDRSRAALRALALVPEACADSGCPEDLARRVTARARRHRQDAIDVAIARVDASLEQSILDGSDTSEITLLTRQANAIWRWAGRDEQVERFLVQRLTPVIWDRYRDRAWNDVASLLDPLRSPVESLAQRIEADRSKLAYAAPCAQMYVFMAEVAAQFEEQLALAERALALCETHRNGRLVLADLLVERGLRRLDSAVPFGFGTALDESALDIRRAQELFPQLKRLPAAKRRLKQKGIDLDAD